MAQARAETVAPAETTLSVKLDFATLVKVPAATATLVIGNPGVADASVQRNHVLVITGKSYGSTNILALDKDGKPLRQITVRVTAASGRNIVTVQRGMARETYACTPRCEQVLTLGDSKDAFGALNGQIGARNSAAAAGAH
jgi:Flp pilus assembly secretin CpaC